MNPEFRQKDPRTIEWNQSQRSKRKISTLESEGRSSPSTDQTTAGDLPILIITPL